ncbi:MAG: glycosyltransferase [Nitrospirae bacterium]|nr:glycosyltransferase [Nitrospirota bacterium]
MKVLIVSMAFPFPLKSGGRIRVFQLIKRLAAHHRITLLCLAESRADVERYSAHLAPYCERVETVPWRPGLLGLLGRVLAAWPQLVFGVPLVVLNKRSPELVWRLRTLLREERFDLVQIEWIQMAQHVHQADWPSLAARGVLVEHDVAWLPLQRQADVSRGVRRWFWRGEARRMRAYEEAMCRRFARVVAVSRDDAAKLLAAGVKTVDVVPNGVDVAHYREAPRPEKAPCTLMFIGWLRHGPNVDAILYFLDEVYPLIVRELPDVRLVIVGSPISSAMRRAAARRPSVELTGYVPDVRPVLRAATVSVVPLRVGGGTRLKILESMAAGTAVVSTSIGCEGLDVEAERHLLVGDGPDAFARCVVRLLREPELRAGLEREALALVRARYDWSSIAYTMDQVYRAIEKG